MFWPFPVWINCYSDLKNFANSRPSASNFKSFSQSLEHFFLTVGQNNFDKKIQFQLIFRVTSHQLKILSGKKLASNCYNYEGTLRYLTSILVTMLKALGLEISFGSLEPCFFKIIGVCNDQYDFHFNFLVPFSLCKVS